MNLASRGYSLIHDPGSRDTYKHNEDECQKICTDLMQMTEDNPVQQENLGRLQIGTKDFADVTSRIFSQKDPKPLRSGQYKAMNEVRGALRSIEEEENRLLSERENYTNTYFILGGSALGVQFLAAFGLLYSCWHLLKQHERENNEKLEQLKTAKDVAEQALEAKDRFLSTVSHEVRTPMAAVLGLTELLSLQELGQENNELVNLTLDSSMHLLQILNSVLEVARLDSGNVMVQARNFALRPVLGDVRQIVALEAGKKQLTITGFCDEKIPEYVFGDELRVRQILTHLSFNAIKYTEAGRVEISASLKAQTADETVVRFSVIDTGIGISASDQRRIFQAFEQASDTTKRVKGGAGLGLTIAKELVELLRGQVGVMSEPGKGSTFWFEIPFTAGHA